MLLMDYCHSAHRNIRFYYLNFDIIPYSKKNLEQSILLKLVDIIYMHPMPVLVLIELSLFAH